MSTRRWADDSGDSWPITGHVCIVCGKPMLPFFDGQTMHPGCHGDHPPSSRCPECVRERRAHRAQVARLRHNLMVRRLGKETR